MKSIVYMFMIAVSLVLYSCGGNKNYKNPEDIAEQSADTLNPAQKALRESEQKAMMAAAAAHEAADVVLTQIPSNGLPSIVDFNATWCEPCRRMAPMFHELAKLYYGTYNFVSIDVDEHPELAQKYQIQAVPTFIFLDPDGYEGNRVTGMVEAKEFKDLLDHPAWF